MKKSYTFLSVLLVFILAFSGCGATGEKAVGIAVIYGAMAVCSLFLLIGYCYLIRKKDPWFLLLLSSVLVVNIGYSALAVSTTLAEALLANRISYLGSVCLPLSMLMLVLNVSKTSYQKWIPGILLTISVFVFAVAASPGYLNIYYSEISLEIVNGVSSLRKVYGPWHSLYYFYLFGYFSVMIAVIFYSAAKHTLDSVSHSIILAFAVFVNIGVWFIEQFVKIDFEILSVSYIISELFLLGLHLMIQEQENLKSQFAEQPPAAQETSSNVSITDVSENTSAIETKEEISMTMSEECEQFLNGIATLTPTEHTIYELYISQKTTKEVLELLNIKENTLKFHNKNIYSKLGVSSRKQLLERHELVNSF